MSLVVLRSWSDGPPKVRAIAPPDDDRAVYVPDLNGRFLTEEIVVEVENGGKHSENDFLRKQNCGSAISNGSVSDSESKNKDTNPQTVVLRRDGKTKNNARATKSLSLFNPTRRSFNVPDDLVIRPPSVSSPSPENDGGSSIEYTPPASPVNGRYRNLGPELAATIPKRTIKSSWVAGIKSRRNTSTSTTHPHHRLSSSTLKSYSSSPSLAIDTTSTAQGAVNEEESSDYFCYEQEASIFRRLHGNNLKEVTSGVSYRAEDDSQSDRSRSSLSLPYSHSPSPPLSLPLTSKSVNTPNSLRQQIVSHSSKPNGLVNCNYIDCNSEEEVFERGCGGSSYGSLLSNNSDVVLVEVIRKKSQEDPEKSDDSGCNSSESGRLKGKGNIADRVKRFSIGGEVDEVLPRKFAGIRVEGSPGKVARLKESLKRFGRFGRNQSEKIIRNPHKEFEAEIEKCINKEKTEKIDKAENLKETTEKIEGQAENLSMTIISEEKKRENIKSKEEKGNFLKSSEIPRSGSNRFTVSKIESSELNANRQESSVCIEKDSNENAQLHLEEETTFVANKSLVNPSVTEDSLRPNQVGQSGESEQEVVEVQAEEKDHHQELEESKQKIDTEIQNIKSKIKIHIEQVPSDDNHVAVHHPDDEDDSSSSIICQDRSISLQMHSMPTIDINSATQINDGDKEIEASTPETVKSLPSAIDAVDSSHKESSLIDYEQDKDEENFVPVKVMHRMVNGQMPYGKNNNGSNNNNINNGSGTNSNPNCVDSNSHEVYEDVNVNGNSTYAFSSSSCSSSIGDESPSHYNHNANSSNKRAMARKIINDRNGSNGAVSVQVPVQAVNRHVMGYGLNIVDATNNAIATRSISSTPPSEAAIEPDWHRSSVRDSFRGFCEDLLQEKINSLSKVPQVIETNGENEAVINFNEEDSSSIDQDDERENSIEYISISDIKVNDEKKPELVKRSDTFMPNYVISLDLGSSTSGYSYWTCDEADFVRIGNVNGGTTCPTSHKIPSWVAIDDLYLDVEDDEENTSLNTTPTFGHEAFDKYLSEDARGQLCDKWRSQFHESSSYPYTLESKSSDEDLVFTMKSAVRHYGKLAWEQIGQRKKGSTVILVSIPSSYNHRARQLVREAAFGTGLAGQQDTLALIEDPCAAGLYAFHALKSKLGESTTSNSGGTTYLSVDIGGFYLHTSGYRISHNDGKVYRVCDPRSDPIVDTAESLFEAELCAIFTPSYMFNYQNKYRAGWIKLLTEFEKIKNRFNPLPKQKYYVFVPSSFVDHFRRFTSMEIEDALESSEIVWNKSGALGIPHWKMVRFIQPMTDFIKDKIANLVKKYQFEHLVLTGGRAGSKVLVDSIKSYLRDYSVVVHVPKEHTAAVLQGATLSVTNLSPRLIIKSPFSIGVGVMTPFIENEHPEDKKVFRDGKSWCADVWDALIKVDQELELNKIVLRRSYVGAQPGQSVLVLPLFKSSEDPKFVTEESVQKCCELKFNSDQRCWQEVELVIRCRPSELLITAMDGGVMKNYVVVDFLD